MTEEEKEFEYPENFFEDMEKRDAEKTPEEREREFQELKKRTGSPFNLIKREIKKAGPNYKFLGDKEFHDQLKDITNSSK